MTPKQLLNKIEMEANDEIGKARYEGALAVYQCFLDKQRSYYATHKEHNRAYHREYNRIRYRKLHGLPLEDEPRNYDVEKAIEEEVAKIE